MPSPTLPGLSYPSQIENHLLLRGGKLLSPVEADLAMQWETQGIPLTVVYAAIDAKSARAHTPGRLRLLLCQDDLAEQYDNWRRAVGR